MKRQVIQLDKAKSIALLRNARKKAILAVEQAVLDPEAYRKSQEAIELHRDRTLDKPIGWVSQFVKGIGSVLNITPSPQTTPLIHNPCRGRSDKEALEGDWRRVGRDLYKAMGRPNKSEPLT